MYIALFVVALIGLILLARRARRQGRIEKRIRRAQALEQILHLRHLLEILQQHRGLCFGVMSGEQSLESRLVEACQRVDLLIAQARQYESSLFWFPSWPNALAMWQQIGERQPQGLSAEQVLLLHSNLISLVLETIRELAGKHDLILLGGLAPQPPGCWYELLEHSELLGQARAIGTGIAARRQNTELQRNELSLLRHRIADQAFLTLARLDTDPELRPLLDGKVVEAEESLDNLLALMDQLVTARNEESLRAMTYFHCATRAISAHLTLVDLLIERLRRESSRQD